MSKVWADMDKLMAFTNSRQNYGQTMGIPRQNYGQTWANEGHSTSKLYADKSDASQSGTGMKKPNGETTELTILMTKH
jgi:hypothetical protein